MNPVLQKACSLLQEGGYTCVLCNEEGSIHVSTQRGVKPLLDWLDEGRDLRGYSAADKVVGAAAAFLYVLLQVGEVHAPVMSQGALKVFADHGIAATCDEAVALIVNRAGDGSCPMEAAVKGLRDPQEALAAIRQRLQELSAQAEQAQ